LSKIASEKMSSFSYGIMGTHHHSQTHDQKGGRRYGKHFQSL
jgi:hypothetical protein